MKIKYLVWNRAVDPDSLNPDPDPTFQENPDPDPIRRVLMTKNIRKKIHL
jgi:hypothetical protein